MLMLFDANRRLVYTGDAYPEAVQLGKGSYTLRLAVRHDSLELLDKLKALPVVMERELDPAVAVPVYASQSAAVTGGQAAGEVFLGANERLALWLGAPPDDKLPKDAKEGRVLKGHLSLGQLRRGSGAAPARHAIAYVAPPAPSKDAVGKKGGGGKKAAAAKKADAAAPADAADAAAAAGSDAGKKAGGAEAKVAEALRDAKLALLKDLRADAGGGAKADPAAAAAYERLAAEVAADWPAHLPLLLEMLRR